MTCRTGCPNPGRHLTWGECARAARLQIGDLTGTGPARRTAKRLEAYADARRVGLQPPTTKLKDSIATMRAAGA